jgi:hypothetical protein
VLRPDRRTRRAFAGMLVTITVLALIWPASIAAGRNPASSVTQPGTAAGAKKDTDRTPSVRGLGTEHLKGNQGAKRTKPLEHLALDHTNRGTDAAGRGLKAPAVTATPPASVQATSSGAPAATSFGPFDGIDQATTGNIEPPDPWVAVGPDDVVQSTNEMLRFTNREGASTAGDVQLFDFFAFDELVPGNPNYITGIGDPRWTYDTRHNRWLGITLAWHCDTDGTGTNDESVGFVWGAISTGADPTGDYYQFYINYGTFLPDFPGLGTSGDKFTVTANEYQLLESANCTNGIVPDAASTMTFDWAQMLTFPSLPDGTYEFGFDWFSLRAALSPQGSSNTIYVVGEKLLAAPAGNTTSNVVYMTITGTNAGGGTTTSAEKDLTALGVVPPFVDPPAPQQPGGPLPVGIVDRRPTDAIWQDNVLTFASTTGCDPVGGGAVTRDCARVTQLNTSTATPTRRQDMLVATDGWDTWYPGIGVSQSGILHVVYTQSSDAQNEGMTSYDRYQLPSGAIHKLSAAVKLANGGTVAYSGDRWGDFVGVAQDPRDMTAVWQGNQYTHTGGTWATRVSELQTAGSTYVPVTPVRLLDSRPGHNIGLSGVFQANIPRTVDIAGRLGIPNAAVAITGNLTVVNQTQAGYASVTPNPNANPSTASLNFPLGDGRGNNITTPLGATGGVSIVYKASPGKTANFVLDVTGYFLNDATGATYKTLTPVRVLDTRPAYNIGLAGAFQANVNREFQVRGVFGIPAQAIAVTGNLAVTGQTAAGYVSLSTTPPPAVPATSNLNFPLGDTRANGLTIKLSPAGTIFAVYKAPNGKTAHLIFDVSGYYVQDLTGARFVPLTPGRRMDTRFAAPHEGLTGPFLAQTPRTLVVEPYQGVPTNATAITGNLTVVSPSRAGYVSMTPTAVVPPPNATINFPTGDIRGNGTTGPLSGSGSVAFVFMASGGSTHLVFDLTGYFRPATP